MIPLKAFEKVSEYEWRLPLGFRSDMRVPVRFFATRRLLEHALQDASVEQALNASTLPGVMGEVMVMPDVHQGYGFPIGGVAAMSYPDGVISPGGIGYDINCGVRLLSTNLLLEEVEPHLPRLADALNRACPSGVGKGGRMKLSEKELRQVCAQGSKWVRKQGPGLRDGRGAYGRRAAASARLTRASSVRGRLSAGARSWAPWVRAIISWRSRWSRRCLMTRRQGRWACMKAA